jgi:hypothetical protein
MKTLFVFLFLLFSSSAWSELVILRLNFEILLAPKTTPRTNNTILNSYKIRRLLDPINDSSFYDLAIQVDTLKKDDPWKLVFYNPINKLFVDASDKMSFEMIASSQTGVLQTITPQIIGKVFLLGDITEYRVVKISTKLEDKVCEVYSAFNIKYRVVRTDTGDHWYPSSSFSFRGFGKFGDSTCISTFAFTPPKIVVQSQSYWTSVNRTLIISQ